MGEEAPAKLLLPPLLPPPLHTKSRWVPIKLGGKSATERAPPLLSPRPLPEDCSREREPKGTTPLSESLLATQSTPVGPHRQNREEKGEGASTSDKKIFPSELFAHNWRTFNKYSLPAVERFSEPKVISIKRSGDRVNFSEESSTCCSSLALRRKTGSSSLFPAAPN